MVNLLFNLVFLIGSYLLGSINPAYLLSRFIFKKDLRRTGTKNLGASNVFLNVSKLGGAGVAVFDVFKGGLVVYLATLFNLPYFVLYLAILLVILGHIFPFYLHFKGGKGVATALGATLGLFLFGTGFPFLKIAATVLILFAVMMQYYRATLQCKELRYRRMYRLAGLAIPILYLTTTRSFVLLLLGIAIGCYLLIDVLRLSSKKLNTFLFSTFGLILKKKEKHAISASSWFLLSSLFNVLFFQKDIAILSISVFIFADCYAEVYGKKFGTIKLIGKRSLQGSIAYFLSASLIALLLVNFLALEPRFFIFAPFVSALAEQVSIGIDDNLSVPLLTAVVLSLL